MAQFHKFILPKILLSIFIFFFLISIGCRTIKEKVLEEEYELTGGELAGIWYKEKWIPTFEKVTHREPLLANLKKWLVTAVEQSLIKHKHRNRQKTKQKKSRENKSIGTHLQYAYVVKKSPESTPYYSKTLIGFKKKQKKNRTLFLTPGQDEKPPVLEFYIPRQVPSRWKWIIAPHLETTSLDPTQTLFNYIAENIIKNIENIQGKVGIGLEW